MSRGEIKQYVILWDNQPIYKYARKTSKTNGLNLHSNGMAGVELTSENIRELHQGGVLHVEKKDEKPICQKHPVASPFTNHGGQQKSSQMDLWGLFMGHGYTP